MLSWISLASTSLSSTSHKIGFEDVLYAIRHKETHLIINTLAIDDQDFVILGTIPPNMEVETINDLVKQYILDKVIVIYGKNVTDPTVDKKYAQLRGFGFSEVYIYSGGLFEWLLLSDIYGVEEFPLSSSSWAKSKILDPLKYKPPATFARLRLENGRRV